MENNDVDAEFRADGSVGWLNVHHSLDGREPRSDR
jgi:hypothetical protein